jgi:hypothetical protein
MVIVSRLPAMQKLTINKRSWLRVLLGVYAFPLLLVCSSLSVPPADLPLCGLMFLLAALGFVLGWRESRTRRVIWASAVIGALVCGALEVAAGNRITRQRSGHGSGVGHTTANPRPGVDAGWAVLFACSRAWPRATQAERSAS